MKWNKTYCPSCGLGILRHQMKAEADFKYLTINLDKPPEYRFKCNRCGETMIAKIGVFVEGQGDGRA